MIYCFIDFTRDKMTIYCLVKCRVDVCQAMLSVSEKDSSLTLELTLEDTICYVGVCLRSTLCYYPSRLDFTTIKGTTPA